MVIKLMPELTALSNGDSWDEFSQHEHIKKSPYLMPNYDFYDTNKVHI